ncbi:MAG: HdeD family acid-resistance protein [Acidobacteriaceae bacterium]
MGKSRAKICRFNYTYRKSAPANRGELRMIKEAKIHTTVLVAQGIVMIALGLTLFWVSSTMTNILFEATGCVVAVLLTAAGLLLIGVIDAIGGLVLRKGHRRELHFYLLFAAISMVAGLFFWVSPWSSVQLLALLAGLQGLFWGGWDLRFSSHLKDHPRERRALRLMGAITLGLGVLLIIGLEFTSRGALLLLAIYLTFIGVHILMIGLYIHRPWKKILPPGAPVDAVAGTKLL